MDYKGFNFEYLKIGEYSYKDGQRVKMSTPRPFDIITKILSGGAEFIFDDKEITLAKGDTLFIPFGTVYEMVWHGEAPKNAVVHYKFKSSAGRYAHQKVGIELPYEKKPSTPLHSLAMAYSWLSLCLPLLMEEGYREAHSRTKKAEDYIRSHYAEEFSTATLASLVGLSESRFYTVFKNETGMSAVDYKNKVRAEMGARLLLFTDLSIEEIAEKVGFFSAVYFRRVFKREMGVTPHSYRKV